MRCPLPPPRRAHGQRLKFAKIPQKLRPALEPQEGAAPPVFGAPRQREKPHGKQSKSARIVKNVLTAGFFGFLSAVGAHRAF